MDREFVFRAIFGFLIFVLLLGLPESRLYADSKPDQVDVSELYREYPVALGSSLREGWFDPWPHKHFSRNGTPLVHSFGLEPAFLDRDFFLNVVYRNSS